MTKKIGEELYFKRAPLEFSDGRCLPSLLQRRPISQLAVCLSHHSNYFSKVIYLYRALGALRCTPCISRPCWGKASFGARLAARFLLILRRVRLCCGFWLPPPSQKPQRPNQYVYKNDCPLLPLQHSKDCTDAASKASPD